MRLSKLQPPASEARGGGFKRGMAREGGRQWDVGAQIGSQWTTCGERWKKAQLLVEKGSRRTPTGARLEVALGRRAPPWSCVAACVRGAQGSESGRR